MKMYQVLFHLSDGESGHIRAVFGNVNALLDDLGEDRVEVEVVIHGTAIRMLQKDISPHLESIRQLGKRGVRFAACANALKNQNLQPQDVTAEAQVVSSAMGELVRRQAEGWVYIHP